MTAAAELDHRWAACEIFRLWPGRVTLTVASKYQSVVCPGLSLTAETGSSLGTGKALRWALVTDSHVSSRGPVMRGHHWQHRRGHGLAPGTWRLRFPTGHRAARQESGPGRGCAAGEGARAGLSSLSI